MLLNVFLVESIPGYVSVASAQGINTLALSLCLIIPFVIFLGLEIGYNLSNERVLNDWGFDIPPAIS